MPKKVITRTYSVAVSTTPKRVCPENPNRVAIHMIPTTDITVLVTHGQNVAAADGYPVRQAAPLKNESSTDELWAVMASGSGTLAVMEDSEA